MALKNVFGKGANTFFHVHTIDGYQGEENDIILLSLVRSNLRSDIGFMDNRNRLVVALSRARRGLYIFGNSANMVANESSEEIIGRDPLWMPLIEFMRSQGRFDYDKGLPITCRKHNKTIRYNNPDQWLGNAGGCDKKCGGSLFCGHPCAYTCHPFDHDRIVCQIPCEKILLCGHGCAKYCGEQCECSKCEQFYDDHSGDLISTVLDSAVFKGNSKKNAIRNGRSRSSLASPSRRVMFEDSSDIRNEIRSLSVPSTAHTPRSRKGFASPRSPAKSSLGQHSFSTPPNNPWHDWDATLADEDLAEQLRNLDALAPKPDPSILVYKDIHRPVTVENGERVISSSVERIVPRTEVAASQSFENKALKKLNGRGALQYANSDFDVDTFEAVIGRKVPAHLLKRLREASLDNVEVAVNMYFDQCSGPKSLLPPFQYSAVGYTPAEDEECFGCGAERSMLSHPHSFGRCQYCQKMYCCFCLNKCKCLRSTALRSAAPLSPVLEVDCGVNQVSPISDLYDVSPREIERQRQAAHSRRMATGSSATTDIRPPSSASATPVIQVPSPSSAPTEQTTTKSDDEPEGDLMSFD
jgi:hypothetical protein